MQMVAKCDLLHPIEQIAASTIANLPGLFPSAVRTWSRTALHVCFICVRKHHALAARWGVQPFRVEYHATIHGVGASVGVARAGTAKLAHNTYDGADG